jgi:hypothetical protein
MKASEHDNNVIKKLTQVNCIQVQAGFVSIFREYLNSNTIIEINEFLRNKIVVKKK